MMLRLLVTAECLQVQLRDRLREETGQGGLEYAVFAMFIVGLLVAAYALIGPQIRDYIVGTIECILDKDLSVASTGTACSR